VKRLYIAAVIIELFGICLTSFGLAYETIMKADVGFVIITSGSPRLRRGCGNCKKSKRSTDVGDNDELAAA